VKKLKYLIIGFLLASFFLGAYAQTQPDENLFQEAKILIFDKKWEEAQKKLDEIMAKYPQSPWFSQAVFYKAKCLAEQKRKEQDALNTFEAYLQLEEKNANLAEESEVSIIDLAFKLYRGGEKSYLRKIEERLASPNKVVKYYAAFKLSYITEKAVASKGLSVLKQIVEKEKDAELRDRAKIALLRVAPDALSGIKEESSERIVKVLKIRVYDKGKKEPTVTLNIPWALADLALGSIPEKDRLIMRKKGYDLDRIRKDLLTIKGNIIEVIDEDGTIIKMWIE
jgi:hypothetical protein